MSITLRIRRLCDVPAKTLRRILELTKPDSVFHERLEELIDGVGWVSSPEDGIIATVADGGELIGWARTEPWKEFLPTAGNGLPAIAWDTLEAFVREDRRGEGVAKLAAVGISSEVRRHSPRGHVAVFSPVMMTLAHKVGLRPTLFRNDRGEWRRA